jgi:mRNA interferase RelE/StbE
VSREVAREERAINHTAAFLRDDPDGLRSVFEAIDLLTHDPRPAESFAFGSADLRRLHVHRYRILYRITEDQIPVGYIARIPAN